jgi:hypothetical protein
MAIKIDFHGDIEGVIMILTKTRIPSASAFQLSAMFLSSSPAISAYIVKMGPEPSTKWDSGSGSSVSMDKNDPGKVDKAVSTIGADSFHIS